MSSSVTEKTGTPELLRIVMEWMESRIWVGRYAGEPSYLEVRTALVRLARQAEADEIGPVPDFSVCGNCGADARAYCFWDPGDGWTCSSCGMSD